MKLIVEKADLTWLEKNGYLGQEQVGIVWNQLAQKCNQIKDESSSHTIQQKNELSLPEVKGVFLGEQKIYDICIAFSFKNGESLARSIQNRILQKKKKVILASDSAVFDPLEIEKRIASSTALVVLLTGECLKQVEVVFSFLVAKFYYQHPSLVILVHAAESCYFPSHDEQPDFAKDFFSEKAATYLSCYPDEGVVEIVAKHESESHVLENILENFRQKPTDALLQYLGKNKNRKQFPIKELRNRMKPFLNSKDLDDFESKVDKNKDGILDADELQSVLDEMRRIAEAKEEESSGHDEEPTTEDLTTRVFLSHKRSTGQGISGRFYEGLKNSYKVFIDSEAKFKIHNLKLIVQNTEVFVFTMTFGIFLSQWCLEELKSAIENKKRLIIVRELSFQLPDVFPGEWHEVEPVIRNSRELIWIAEYNTACVKALSAFIGSPDDRHFPAINFFSTRDGKSTLTAILNKFQSTNVLDLNRTIPLPLTVEVDAALDFVLESIPADKITAIHITAHATSLDGANDSILPGILARLPNIQELSLAECGGLVTDDIVKDLCSRYPSLRKLDLEKCIQLTDEAMKSIKELDHLTYLNLDKIARLRDDAMEILASGCPKLEVLIIGFADLTHKAFEHVSKLTTLKELEFPYLLNNHEDAKKFIADHPDIKIRMEPIVFDYAFVGQWIPAIVKSYTATTVAIHFYGQTDWTDEDNVPKERFAERIAPFGTHKHNYASQDRSHATSDCPKCATLHNSLRDVKFDGTPNRHFMNDWYFSHPEGKEIIKPYLEQAAGGQLQITVYTIPTGIRIPSFMKAIFEKYPEETIRELYLQYSEQAAEYLSLMPHLKLLSYNGSLDGFQKAAKVFPPQLEEFRFNGYISDEEGAKLLARTITNVTTLYLKANNSPANALVALFQEKWKLRTLTIRNSNMINSDVLLHIAQNCKDIMELNLTLNPILVEQKDEVIVHLKKNFPTLKKLVIDLPIQKSAKFEEFKTARPNVTVVEFESLYLKDVQDSSSGQWYPAIQIGETKGPNATAHFHLYGVGRAQEATDKVEPFLSNSSNYGPQDYHTEYFCFYCSLLHDVCEKVKFDGQLNLFFKDVWYFETEEGKELLKKYLPQGPENRITMVSEYLPSGIQEWAVIRALAKEADLQKTYTVRFPLGINELSKLLEQPLPISGVEFLQQGSKNAETLRTVSQKLPNLKRLVVEDLNIDSTSWNNFDFPELEYLDINGCTSLTDDVMDGIAKCTKLTHFSVPQTGLTDKAIELLAKNWSKLTSLNLRTLPVTARSVQTICQHCPELQSLNLILCSKVSATACKFIQEGLPKLKELKVPFHWVDTEALAQLKSARPHITYIEKSELIDASSSGTWYPAVIINEASTSYLLHLYGTDERNIWVPTDSSSIAPLFTNKDNYGKQKETHFGIRCEYCEILNPLCEHLSFGQSKNIAYMNDWYFDSLEGQHFINQIVSQVKSTGKLELGMNLPCALSYEKAMKTLGQAIPRESLRHISFSSVVSSDTIQELLTDKPSLVSLSFVGPFKDEHMAVIANNCKTLTDLVLLACDVTSEGLETLASKLSTLEILTIKACKNVTDKGVEALLLANNALEAVQLDFQHQLTGATVQLLANLPRLQTVTLSYKLGQKEIIQESNSLKKKKPLLKIFRGDLLLDCQTSSNWYPSFATEFNETGKKIKVHSYGRGDSELSEGEISTCVAEAFTHTTNYGYLSTGHMNDSCSLCKQLNVLCNNFTFGSQNQHTYMSW